LRTAKSCGPDASTPASSLQGSASDGDKKARSPGRARYKPLKPSRAGMPGDPGATVVTMLACSLHILHARLRVHWAPGIPHALSWAEDSCTARTLRAAGSRTRIRLLLPATWRPVARLSHRTAIRHPAGAGQRFRHAGLFRMGGSKGGLVRHHAVTGIG
jgi:hypothetical protein